jgi:hypothetical protein
MSTVSKQFHKWIKTDCDTSDFPLWQDFNWGRQMCFGLKPLISLKSWEFAVLATRIQKHKYTKLGLLLVACCQIPVAELQSVIRTKEEDVKIKIDHASQFEITLYREKRKRNLTLRIFELFLYREHMLNEEYFRHLAYIFTNMETWKFGLQRELAFYSRVDAGTVHRIVYGDKPPPGKRLKK